MKIYLFHFFLITLLVHNILFSQQFKDSNINNLKQKVDSLINFGIKKKAFPGAQVLIFKRDSIQINKAYGYHSFDSITPVTNAHLFDLASLTKILASTITLMKLHELYDLDLNDPVSRWIPSLKRSNKKKHSLKKILSHNAGWIPYISHQNLVFNKKGKFRHNTLSFNKSIRFPDLVSDSLFVHRRYQNKIFKRIKKTKLLEGDEMVYSGMFYFFIPELVKRLSGKSLVEFLNYYFYKPMNLERISYLPLKKFSKKELIPTERDSLFRKQLIHGWVHDEAASLMGGISGNAGLFANAESIAPLLQMLLQKGSYNGKQYLTSKTINTFVQRTFPESCNPRGLGFDKPSLEKEQNRYPSNLVSSETFGHTGFTGTMAWVDPTNNFFVILLTNRVYPNRNQKGLYTLNIRPQLLDYVVKY